MDLKDERWAVIAALIPKPRRHADDRGRGRPADLGFLCEQLGLPRGVAP